MTLLRTSWSCPYCDSVLELTMQVVDQKADGDALAMTMETVPESTEAVYAHAETHGLVSS